MGRKPDFQEALNRAAEMGGICHDTVFVSNTHKIRWTCREGHEFLADWNHTLRGDRTWCPICARKTREETKKARYGEMHPSIVALTTSPTRKMRRTQEEAERVLAEIGITLLSTYTECKAPVQVRYSCGHEKETTVDNALNRGRKDCPDCVVKAAQESWVSYWKEKTGVGSPSGDRSIIDKAIDSRSRNPKYTSKGETELNEWIKSLGFSTRKARWDHMEFDIVIDELKIAIEYNGEWFHSEEAGKTKFYHRNKQLVAKAKGYRLIHIWDTKWRDNKEQIKSYLTTTFGKNARKLQARKCEVKQVDYKEAYEFFDKYHIQGHTTVCYLFLGLYSDGELVACGSFGPHHRGKEKGIVLNRWAGKFGVSVAGGLSRISKAASNYFKQDIASWADNTWASTNGYINSGWAIEEVLNPDYFYFKGGIQHPKHSCTKEALGALEGETEDMARTRLGYRKVWDCGKTRLIYKYIP